MPDRSFTRGRLAVGLVLVSLVGAGLVFGASRLRSSPGPGRLVVATARAVYLHDLAEGRARLQARLPERVHAVVPSPDARFVAYTLSGGALWLLDLEDGARWQVSERATRALGWTPGGRVVALEGAADRDLVAVDPRGRRTELIAEGFEGTHLHWLEDDRFVAATPTTMVDVEITPEGLVVENLAGNARPLAVAPGGEELLYGTRGTRGPRVRIATLEGAALAAPRTVFSGEAERAAVSPQGFVAFTGRDADGEDGTWVLESRTAPPRRVAAGLAEQLAWTRDGSALVTLTGGALYAYEVREQRRLRLDVPGAVKAFVPET